MSLYKLKRKRMMVTNCDVWCQGGGSGLKAATPKAKAEIALALMGDLRKKVPCVFGCNINFEQT